MILIIAFQIKAGKVVAAPSVAPEMSTPPQRPVSEVTRLTTAVALEDPRSPGSRTPLAVVKNQGRNANQGKNGGRRAIPFKA